jgi:hypothetical protein
MVASSSFHLKWMHKLVTVDFRGSADASDVTYQVEDFFHTDDEATVRDVEAFLDTHPHISIDNLKDMFVQDVMLPIEHAVRCGVRDADASDDEILELRRRKALFILTAVIPRMFFHKNFAILKDLIAHGLTRMLKVLVELSETITPDENDVMRQTYFFRAKEFLACIALQIWGVCMYENGIPVIKAKAVPLLRKLAMLDCLDPNWNYAGGFEMVLRLLEERTGRITRISSDRLLQESSDMFRLARNAIRCQILELTGLKKDESLRKCFNIGGGTNMSTTTLFEYTSPRRQSSFELAPQMCAYFPKCSAYFCSDVETPQNPHRRRCYRCHFYHWCSPACQDYSDKVSEHHRIYCQVCPENKANACRSQMQEHLNIQPHDEEAEESICCHGCGIAKAICKQPMTRCEVCMAVSYCSKTCQEWDWHCGGHASKCESPL